MKFPDEDSGSSGNGLREIHPDPFSARRRVRVLLALAAVISGERPVAYQMIALFVTLIGIAIIVWEKISGVGVIIPPTIKAPKIIILRCFAKTAELMIPILARTSKTKGKLKIIPKGNINEIKNDRY